MPFVDAKLAVSTTEVQKEALKTGFGEAVSTFGKGESWLMVGIDDEYDLWFGGEKLQKGAFVSVSLVGSASDEACKDFTQRACKLLETVLGIPGDAVYVTYHPMQGARWGWNSTTF